MQRRMTWALLCHLLWLPLATAQATEGVISGRVMEAASGSPMEYVNVVLFRQDDRTQVTGDMTDIAGTFVLNGIAPGKYYLEASFVGYEHRVIKDIAITADAPRVVLPDITLYETVIPLPGVEVTGEKPAMTYEVDKKVINVSRMSTTLSGTAVDVLENVPSVEVDLEGNVSLRGSGNFTLLIDGKPTVLEPSEALEQIPANTIETIEIMTNPSARYDPEGTTGIINVILKKQRRSGFSGTTSLNAGRDDNYGGNALISYRLSNATVFIGANMARRNHPGTQAIERNTLYHDTLTYMLSDGSSRHSGRPMGLRGGVDFSLSARDRISISGRYGLMHMEHGSTTDYQEWTDPASAAENYLNEEQETREGYFTALSLDYDHQFGLPQHKLALQLFANQRANDEASLSTLTDSTGVLESGQRTDGSGPQRMANLKADYTLPFAPKGRFETGYQGRFRTSDDTTNMFVYDPISGDYFFESRYSHVTSSESQTHGLYGTLSGTWLRAACQFGLRAEYANRGITLVDSGATYRSETYDLFPTVHLSYELPGKQQFMTSYTRRVDRPRDWWLAPFITWMDPYTVRQGNPEIDPEYIDSYELGFQAPFGASQVSLEAYYRYTHNLIEQVMSVYADNVMLHTIENVGSDRSLGVELRADLKLRPWWNVTGTADCYDYAITTESDGTPFTQESFTWNGRLQNEFVLPIGTRLQLNTRYFSPRLSSQGERAGQIRWDAAVKQEFFQQRLSITLQARDLFGASAYEYTVDEDDYYYHLTASRRAPMVSLQVSYTFNNQRREWREEETEEDLDDGSDVEF